MAPKAQGKKKPTHAITTTIAAASFTIVGDETKTVHLIQQKAAKVKKS